MSDSQQPIHVIRLHAAWHRTERDHDIVLSQRASLTLPDTTPVDPASTSLTYVRRFNSPTGLDASSRVQFSCAMVAVAYFVEFNGVRFDVRPSSLIDLTERLGKHNEIVICVPVGEREIIRGASAQLLITSS